MKKKEVNYTPDSLPPVTAAQNQNLERLATTPDNQINYDDIPRLTEAQLAEFKRPEHFRPVKNRSPLTWMRMYWRGSRQAVEAISHA